MSLTYESVYEKVAKIAVEELDVEESAIKKESNFQDDLGADSLALVEIIMKIEEEFDIEIPDDQSEKIRTVDQAVKYILEKKA
ncbi:MAG TPA: acyl carrier protein [Candidatus Wallbacteria bacterium]|nr:MAG: Acyl carrier protein [bacterium ADurb.Bin243]HPG59680.1 acyl carrier protein [Candidatus Wallbacteria bacterium]